MSAPRTRARLAYAYPSSTRAGELGHAKTGCHYVAGETLREDGSWSASYVWSGTEGGAAPTVTDELRQLLRQLLRECQS